MNRAELQRQLEFVNRALSSPQHHSPFQLKAYRKLKTSLKKKLDQCPPPKPNPQLRLSI